MAVMADLQPEWPGLQPAWLTHRTDIGMNQMKT